jgi:nitrogen regulatory protein PII
MKLYEMKLLTAICEIYATKKVIDIFERHKVRGYTITEVSGNGEAGLRGVGLPEEKNMKIETIVRNETAEKIIEEITLTLLQDHIIIIYLTDTKIIRTEKFT